MQRHMMILKSIKRMNPELEQALRENLYPIPVKKGQVLQPPGVLNDNLYFVEKGLLRYFWINKNRNCALEFRWRDQFMNTLKSCNPDNGEGYGIEALEESLIWCIPGDFAMDLCEKSHRFTFHFREILMCDHIASRHSIQCSLPKNGFENFKSLCQRYPQIIGRVPTKYLADFIQVPEKKLKHLLDSQLSLHMDLRRRRRNRPDTTF